MPPLLAFALAGLVAAPAAAQPPGAPADTSLVAVAEAATVSVPDGVLHGTLLLPAATDAAPPVALLIAGSGPTDRDGNSAAGAGANHSLRLLAEGLAARGVASLRYDKRGIGESQAAVGEDDVVFGDFADDAAAWTDLLRQDARFGRVVIVGHSEGAHLATLAAARGHVDGVVLVAGAGEPIGVALRRQLGAQLPPDLMAEADRVLSEMEAGGAPTDVPAPLAGLFAPSVVPFLISWMALDPAEAVAAFDGPRLVIQGTTDIQVGVDDAARLAEAAGTEAVLIEGMNHVLKAVPADMEQQRLSYADPQLPVVPELLDRIAAFAHQR